MIDVECMLLMNGNEYVKKSLVKAIQLKKPVYNIATVTFFGRNTNHKEKEKICLL